MFKKYYRNPNAPWNIAKIRAKFEFFGIEFTFLCTFLYEPVRFVRLFSYSSTIYVFFWQSMENFAGFYFLKLLTLGHFLDFWYRRVLKFWVNYVKNDEFESKMTIWVENAILWRKFQFDPKMTKSVDDDNLSRNFAKMSFWDENATLSRKWQFGSKKRVVYTVRKKRDFSHYIYY